MVQIDEEANVDGNKWIIEGQNRKRWECCGVEEKKERRNEKNSASNKNVQTMQTQWLSFTAEATGASEQSVPEHVMHFIGW